MLGTLPLEPPRPKVNTLSHMQPAAADNSALSNKRAADSVEDLILNISFIFRSADANFLLSKEKLTIRNVTQVNFGTFRCEVSDNAITYKILQVHGKNTDKVKSHIDY